MATKSLSPGLKTPGSFLKRDTVETTRIDPSSFLKKETPEQSLMDNLEPVVAPPRYEAPPAQAELPASPPPVLPAPKKDLVIDNQTLYALIEEYGFEAGETHRYELFAAGIKSPLVVDVRAPNWDDHNWGLMWMQKQFGNASTAIHVQTETQRTHIYQAALACRCVVKIKDQFIWDIFGMRDLIKKTNPQWNGESHIGIPEVIASPMTETVIDFFRHRVHMDYLVELDDAVTLVGRKSSPPVEAEAAEDLGDQPAEEDNPT